MQEIGIPPFLGYLLLTLAFIALSKYLFYKTIHANWVYLFFFVMALWQVGEGTKTQWLHTLFSRKDYFKIRGIENMLLAIPFCLFSLYEGVYPIVGWLLVAAIGFIFIRPTTSWQYVLPTPFKKIPFEWIVGFRKNILLLFPIYFLLYKGWEVGNFNLSLATIGMLFILGISFYANSEPTYFVWIFSTTTRSFLFKKIKTAIIGVSVLIMPVLLVLLLGYPLQPLPLLITLLLGYLFLIASVLAKYSAFHGDWGLPQLILMGLCVFFPPILLIVIPIFYKQARKRVSGLLMEN